MAEDKKIDKDIELTKAELFKQEPENFYHINDLAVAVTKRDDKGRQVLVNTTNPDEMGACMFSLERHCNEMLNIMLMKAAKEKQEIASVQKIIKGT